MSRLREAIVVIAVCVLGANVFGQGTPPFKLGTFELSGRMFVGVVIKDSAVIDLTEASAALKTPAAKVAMPADMKDLIARWDNGVRARIGEILANTKQLEAGGKPAFVHPLKSVKTLPPIMYPSTMLNVAVNYRAHGAEMAGGGAQAGGVAQGDALPGTTSAPGIWERKPDDKRWNPYMFFKSPTVVIADGEAIRLPVGRTNIDWECELGVVIGRTADHVSAENARQFIFGYTLENDVSDRGGRGDTRHGSDWVIGKNHDTFAPMGPFIVPKEFVPNPQNLPVKFTLNGQLMQDANTSFMIHTVDELVSYGSHILTLRPGDVLATGSPAGVGSARKPPIFFKAGDVSVCSYEGIGTLTNPIVAPRAPAR
ncbi:MAG TPA: fumarylacetoacetate hydrolase family protein [Vicinamibacterales bacterium]|nr:fumarylacetoacetate hydrolase family protein [Vicinamibacterales bacterium]